MSQKQKRAIRDTTLYQILWFLALFLVCFLFVWLKEFSHCLLMKECAPPLIGVQIINSLRGSFQTSPKAITFHRIIKAFPEGRDSKFVLNLQEEDKHCQDFDEFGVNNCHFSWSDHAVGDYWVELPQVLDESASIQANLLLEGHIPYTINCALCGQPCEVGLKLIDFQYSFHMPPCPVDLSNRTQDFHYALWSHSPTEGLITIPIEGTVIVFSSPNEKLAEFDVFGTIR